MRLAGLQLVSVGPFEDLELSLIDTPWPLDEESAERPTPSARPMTVLFGADGTGKTSLLAALAQSRPGHALPLLVTPPRHPRATTVEAPDGPGRAATRAPPPREQGTPACVAHWLLSSDDPARPHPLVVTGPNVSLEGETPEATTARRREQAIFDRRAQAEGGFAFLSLSGARWFSRAPTVLTAPERTLLRHDVRASATFDDPTRADLARETKQALAYATIARALPHESEPERFVALEAAMRETVDVLLSPFGLVYAGVDPRTLEPRMRADDGEIIAFDALPRGARHMASFGALGVRALAAAYPTRADLREAEIVIAIDDVESQQEAGVLRDLTALLRRALPGAQWILTTSSHALAAACEPDQVIALRRAVLGGVELFDGPLAVIH
jgi:hypothetical protein